MNFTKLNLASSLIEWRSLRVGTDKCTLCRSPVTVKLGSSEHSVRCIRCGANPSAMSLGYVLQSYKVDLGTSHIYELSSRGPFFRHLKKHAPALTCSEYFDDVVPGETKNGVTCQDVQHLLFEDQSFDVCTSTDVFEHVADDGKAFAELHRVLKPGGLAMFTVPLDHHSNTVERAKLVNGVIEHIMEPEYHGDHIRGLDQVLCFRNYGADISTRLELAGFQRAEIIMSCKPLWWCYGRGVVVAEK